MACRGYLLALDDACIGRLRPLIGDDDAVIDMVQELDATDAPDTVALDKAWDGIHRCLTEGRLGCQDGEFPLNAVILGGEPLYDGGDYIVSYNSPDDVRAVAAALATVDMAAFTARFYALDQQEYVQPLDADELRYLTAYLDGAAKFYARAAQNGWASVFVADQ